MVKSLFIFFRFRGIYNISYLGLLQSRSPSMPVRRLRVPTLNLRTGMLGNEIGSPTVIRCDNLHNLCTVRFQFPRFLALYCTEMRDLFVFLVRDEKYRIFIFGR